jgi:hypothetical protein
VNELVDRVEEIAGVRLELATTSMLRRGCAAATVTTA